jgi:two-component sensor histidine kinase
MLQANVSPPERRRLGTVVLEAMAAQSINGAVDLDYVAAGVTWRLTCPAPSALES